MNGDHFEVERGSTNPMKRVERALVLAMSSAVLVALSSSPSLAQSHAASPGHPLPWQSKTELLGREIFFDTDLSTPAGQACASCHAPEAGFRFPSSSVNEAFGVATGAIRTRFGNRSVPTVSYAKFIPTGRPVAHFQLHTGMSPFTELLFIGGLFWDGRAVDLENQATFPFQNPNEMNNLVHGMGSPALVVSKIANGEYADLFRRVYGADIFSQSTDVVFADVCEALATYERSDEVSPFSSKYDAYLAGEARLTPEELDGLHLMTGTEDGFPSGKPYRKNAQCIQCHGISDSLAQGPSLWTFSCYVNIGVPKNRHNPYYSQTDSASNPQGYNPLGADYIDFALGDFLYPLNGLPPGNIGPGSDGFGDYLAINGAFKTPTLRNADKRPSPDFVKAYMHNGVFKTLKEVVHFYNTRNLTTFPGEVIDFTLPDPYANLIGEPLWPPPEVSSPESLLNPTGDTSDAGGQVGNLRLTDEEEDHIVAFLKTLSDGFVSRKK
jgi:cytochrome c peroxidase